MSPRTPPAPARGRAARDRDRDRDRDPARAVVAAPAAALEPGAFAALASPRRLQILEWLRDPRAHFPPQRDGDLVRDGVCVVFIAGKLGVRQPTATAHLQILARAGLVTSRRVGQWTFYKRHEKAIRAFKRAISRGL